MPIAMEIAPAPTDDEVAAIMAAAEVLWPRSEAVEPVVTQPSTGWRFSGRWWA